MNKITTGIAIIFLGAALHGIGRTAESSPVRAAIQPEKDRKVAAGFRLVDASSQSISLSKFHGKVILLDFLGNRMWRV